jgi:hypothetical protein
LAAARVPDRVGDAKLVADVAVDLADGIARLEIDKGEPRQDVRAADDEHAEVHEIEEERQSVENAAMTTTAPMIRSWSRLIIRAMSGRRGTRIT